jgi:hypothetical protein
MSCSRQFFVLPLRRPPLYGFYLYYSSLPSFQIVSLLSLFPSLFFFSFGRASPHTTLRGCFSHPTVSSAALPHRSLVVPPPWPAVVLSCVAAVYAATTTARPADHHQRRFLPPPIDRYTSIRTITSKFNICSMRWTARTRARARWLAAAALFERAIATSSSRRADNCKLARIQVKQN